METNGEQVGMESWRWRTAIDICGKRRPVTRYFLFQVFNLFLILKIKYKVQLRIKWFACQILNRSLTNGMVVQPEGSSPDSQIMYVHRISCD